MGSEPLVVLCTVPDRETAEHIATGLVDRRLAACVNIVPGLTSVYRWLGAVHTDPELLLVIKTHSTVFATLRDNIKAMHPYELPEVLAVPVRDGLPEYLDWISASITEAP